jgi:hypothetical protein
LPCEKSCKTLWANGLNAQLHCNFKRGLNEQSEHVVGASALEEVVPGACLAAATLVSYAQTAIEAVSGSVQGGSEVIRIDLSQP